MGLYDSDFQELADGLNNLLHNVDAIFLKRNHQKQWFYISEFQGVLIRKKAHLLEENAYHRVLGVLNRLYELSQREILNAQLANIDIWFSGNRWVPWSVQMRRHKQMPTITTLIDQKVLPDETARQLVRAVREGQPVVLTGAPYHTLLDIMVALALQRLRPETHKVFPFGVLDRRGETGLYRYGGLHLMTEIERGAQWALGHILRFPLDYIVIADLSQFSDDLVDDLLDIPFLGCVPPGKSLDPQQFFRVGMRGFWINWSSQPQIYEGISTGASFSFQRVSEKNEDGDWMTVPSRTGVTDLGDSLMPITTPESASSPYAHAAASIYQRMGDDLRFYDYRVIPEYRSKVDQLCNDYRVEDQATLKEYLFWGDLTVPLTSPDVRYIHLHGTEILRAFKDDTTFSFSLTSHRTTGFLESIHYMLTPFIKTYQLRNFMSRILLQAPVHHLSTPLQDHIQIVMPSATLAPMTILIRKKNNLSFKVPQLFVSQLRQKLEENTSILVVSRNIEHAGLFLSELIKLLPDSTIATCYEENAPPFQVPQQHLYLSSAYHLTQIENYAVQTDAYIVPFINREWAFWHTITSDNIKTVVSLMLQGNCVASVQSASTTGAIRRLDYWLRRVFPNHEDTFDWANHYFPYRVFVDFGTTPSFVVTDRNNHITLF